MRSRAVVAGLGTTCFVLLALVLILIGRGTDGLPSPVFGAPSYAYPTCTVADSSASTGGASVDITFTGPRADRLCRSTVDAGGADYSLATVCSFTHGPWSVTIAGDAAMQRLGQEACTEDEGSLSAILDEVTSQQTGQ